MTFRNLSEIKAANEAAGGEFFHAKDSPVSKRIYPTNSGAVIVSSKYHAHLGRRWSVWLVKADGNISPAWRSGSPFPSDSAAHTAAREAARADGWGNRA